MQGSYTWAEHAFAADWSDMKVVEPAAGGQIHFGVTLGVKVQTHQQNGAVTHKHDINTNFPGQFALANGFMYAAPPAAYTTPAKLATSTANVNMSANPVANNQVMGKITVSGSAVAALPPGGTTDYADSLAYGNIKIYALAAHGLVHNGGFVPVPFKVDTGNVELTSGTNSNQAAQPGIGASYVDPVVLTITNSVTGALIAQQALFDECYRTIGNATVSFDATNGLVLKASAGSDADVNYSTLGSWVENPFAGSASLSNGMLTTTGFLAGLAWDVSTINGVTSASLAASAFEPDFNVMVLPTGLGSPTDDLVLTLSDNGQGYTSDYNTAGVPEPRSVVLLGLGLLLISARTFAVRRKNRPS